MRPPLSAAPLSPERRRFLRLALGSAAALVDTSGCDYGTVCPSPRPLGRIGVYVASPWEGLARGDVIRSLDGLPLGSPEALEAACLDGKPHAVEIDRAPDTTLTLELRCTGRLPFAAVGVDALRRTPFMAHQGLVRQAWPRFGLRALADGQPRSALDGRAQLLALVSLASSRDRQDAALTLQVLQKAQADLAERDVSVVYAHLPWAAERRARRELLAVDVRDFMRTCQVSEAEGGPLPLLPAYAPAQGWDALPAPQTELLAEPPNLLVIDARGVVRWHSVGATPDPSGEIALDMVYTAVRAAIFAREELA